MKRFLGIVLAILGCIALFSLLVLAAVAKGATLGVAILVVLISVAITLVIIGWIFLVSWLLF